MVKPNFFILGAAKSGTTSVYFYLNQHPQVFMPHKKELYFFNEYFQVVKDPITYFESFENEKKATRIGEASHIYMSNPKTAEVLKLLFPDAKFIVILRNPADRAYSLYHHMRRLGYERVNGFEKALKIEEERLNSKTFKYTCKQSFYNYLYFHSGLYGSQIARYLEFFDKSQFHILTLNQLKNNPNEGVRNIFNFLGIDDSFKPEIEVYNKSHYTPRTSLFYSSWRTQIVPFLKKYKLNLLRGMGDYLIKNLVLTKIPPLNIKVRDSLLQRYEDDLFLLKKITGIDIRDM